MESAETEEGVGSRKTDERWGILGKGINAVESVWAFEEKGKTLSWNTTSLDMKKEWLKIKQFIPFDVESIT